MSTGLLGVTGTLRSSDRMQRGGHRRTNPAPISLARRARQQPDVRIPRPGWSASTSGFQAPAGRLTALTGDGRA